MFTGHPITGQMDLFAAEIRGWMVFPGRPMRDDAGQGPAQDAHAMARLIQPGAPSPPRWGGRRGAVGGYHGRSPSADDVAA